VGPAGADGFVGSNGATGATGSQGPQGIQGLTGPVGPTGSNGAQGIQGPAGSNGAQGIQGATGAAGANGLNGGVSVVSVKTANYSALTGELVRVDSAAGTFTVTLPANPADGARVEILDVTGSCSLNYVLVIAADARPVEFDVTGVSVNFSGAHAQFIYSSYNNNWKAL
jgi:hypothetical protein